MNARPVTAISPAPRWSVRLRSANRFDGEQGNAVHAVGGAGAARLCGEELVQVRAYLLDVQAGVLDRLAVGVLLGGAADARRPQVGVAHDRLGELPLGDDIRLSQVRGGGELARLSSRSANRTHVRQCAS